jgi:superfamily II DNA or RNA helicase
VPDIFIPDEAHLSAAKSQAEIIEYYRSQGALIVGLTATPWRLSGEGLNHLYDVMVQGPTTRWLIENGFLSDYKLFAPSRPDLGDVHTRMGDYINAELETAMDNSSITGNAISHYIQHGQGRRTLCFCVSIKHSNHVAEQFRSQGIMAAHIDGETKHEDRVKAFKMFADGEIKVITSVAIFSEGFDLSAQIDREVPVEACILLRPTQSLTLYLQQVGRALRRKSEPALILDHAGNTMRHGLPDDDREWTLEGNPKRSRGKKEVEAVNIRQCPQCFMVHRPTVTACPSCGHIYVAAGRIPTEKEGELVEVDKEAQRVAHKKKMKHRGWLISKATCFEDFMAIEKEYGYKKGWGRINYNLRRGKRGVV